MKKLLLLSICFLISGCAFFNALYNGRAAYKKAQDTEKKMLLEGKDSAEIAKATEKDYKRAIAKAEKTISYYPKSERQHDDATYLKGIASLAKGDYAVAINSFTTLQKGYKDSKWIPESWLNMGIAQMKDGDYTSAQASFSYVIEHYPKLNKNMRVSLLMGELTAKLEGKGRAIAVLEKAYLDAKSDYEKLLTIKKIAELYSDLKFYDKVVNWLQKLPDFDKKHTELFFVCEKMLLIALTESEKHKEAEELAIKLIDRSEYFYHLLELNLYYGNSVYAQKRYDDAYDIFNEVSSKNGDDLIRAKAWYYMSEISIDVRADIDKGKEELAEAEKLANSDKEFLALVKARLEGLSNIATLQERLENKNDTTMNSELVNFRIGEAYWLDAKLPDSALVHFDRLLEDTLTSDSVRALTLFSKAFIYMKLKGDTLQSDSILEKIIVDFPSSEIAKESQRLLEIPITVVTRRDSAVVRFKQAEELAEKTEGYSKDLYYSYLICAMKFPDVEDIAAKSLYNAGFVVEKRPAFEDGVVDTAATKIFSRLCKEYPESEECLDVKPMLEGNLVKSYVSDYETMLEEQDKLDSLVAEPLKEEKKLTKDNLTIPDFYLWF